MLSLYLAGVLVASLIGIYRVLYLLVVAGSVRAANVRLLGGHLSPWQGSFVRKRSSWRVWLAFVLVLRPRDYVTKLVSSVLTCKLPLDGDPVAVHAASPGPSLLAQARDVSDSAF